LRQRPASYPGTSACAYAGDLVAAHGQAASSAAGCLLRSSPAAQLSCRQEGFAGRWSIWAVGRQRTDHVAGAPKRPNRTIASSWAGLYDRPVGPARSRATTSTVAVPLPPAWPDEHPVHSGPGTASGSAARKGMRRGSPTQRQGRTRSSPLPPDRRGGRHPARVAQDRVPLGQGRQATVPEDAWGHHRYPAAEIHQLADELQVQPTT
jgi:hypothetical protein